MERALNLGDLTVALGEHPGEPRLLPTSAELQSLMADTEVRLFTGRPAVSDELIEAAWYLHGVASASAELNLYEPARQRRAFQISAHVFDLTLLARPWPREDRLRFSFAAQIGYHRGELEPNAISIWRRVEDAVDPDAPVLNHIHTLGMEAGVAFLGLDRRRLFGLMRSWRGQLATLRRQIGIETLADTMFGAPDAVVDGVNALLRFLAFGDQQQLARARELFTRAIEDDTSAGDLDSRWVAAHLRSVADDVDQGAVWSLLPPDLPRTAYQALTLTDPSVLTLWSPQRALVSADPSPLSPDTRRVVLSLPTSAGKTLLAQLLMVTHLAAAETSICYVAPMRSLGREVRRAMRSRLAPLRRELGRDLPDFFPEGILDLSDLLELVAGLREPPPDVDIMTPERLGHLLREDAEAVLDRYGLFIFDEAHLLGESGRGFTLETILAFLHWRTRDTPHRLVLLSAALGNRGQLMTWLDPNGEGLLFESDWRGPRRLNALFSTRVDWQTSREEAVRSSEFPKRLFHPLYGDIRLRPAENARVQYLQLVEPVGELAVRATAEGVQRPGRETSHSTPMYRAVARLVVAVGHGGPVMVVTSTRADARRMAQAIAELVDPAPAARPLAEFVRLRLGDEHPLVGVLTKGVSYHHAALPVDVLEAIELGVREDQVQFIASTTSLTEGVNLPVRTVVLAETVYEGQPVDALLRGARLLNAMGRAGRACKECEGWVVLVRNRAPQATDFELLRVDEDQLNVESQLADAEALEALATLEAELQASEDALFSIAARQADNFVSFVWFLLASEEARQRSPAEADLGSALASTLAFVQLAPAQRELIVRVAERVRHVYSASDPVRRRRWARSGTSVGSARVIDTISDELANAARQTEEVGGADQALAVLNEINAIERLTQLSEAPREWRFRASVSGSSRRIDVELREVLRDWLHGASMPQLADRYLAEVPSPDFRIEQIVDAVTQHFEHFLSWTLGAVIEQTNQRLAEEGRENLVCPPLPLFVRYGVDSIQALELLTSGVRSRELAKAVADEADAHGIEPTSLRDWVRGMSIVQWRDRFRATAADVLDLLEYARVRRGNLLQSLLEAGEVEAELDDDSGIDESIEVVVVPEAGLPPPQLVVRRPDEPTAVSRIPTRLHSEVQAILDTGLDVRSTLTRAQLRLALAPDES